VATWIVVEDRAAACGGCVSPPNTFTAVDSHRMVIALGVDETILWDQFIYSGAPEEFAWILPVPSSQVVVELASPDFIAAMDEATTPQVRPASVPPCDVATAGGGCGCGEFGPGFAPGPVDGVEVYSQAVVGPYETVTLGSEDPNALFAWMAGNGYAFPQDHIATLDHYIAQGSAFVILRLRPDASVSAMQPVRVRFRGFMGTFPLKMVVVGAPGPIDLSLWVIGEQRYGSLNYATTTVDSGDLVWDWATNTSNYGEVFEDTIFRNGGRAWVTEYAAPLADSELAELLSTRALDDFTAARAQVHYPYVTRLRTRMSADYLNEDLQLAIAEDSTGIDRELIAQRDINYECNEAATAGVTGRSRGNGAGQWLLLAGFLLLVGAAAPTRARSWPTRRT